MRKYLGNVILAVVALNFSSGVCNAQGLLTVEGVTLGQSKTEALRDGFKLERFEDTEFLVKDISTNSRFRRSVSLRTAKSENATESERIVSITVSQLFQYNDEGMKACQLAAQGLDNLARKAGGSAVANLKPKAMGSALSSHLGTVYEKSLRAGSLEVDSSCVAKKYETGPMYSLYFAAGLY